MVIRGHVVRVEPAAFTKISALGVEEQRVNVIIGFDDAVTAYAQLGDRYRVEVRVVIWEAADTIKVPISCLVREHDRWTAFVVHEDRAMRARVEVGHRNDTEAEVLDGLTPGMRVIAFPSDAIHDGARVIPVN